MVRRSLENWGADRLKGGILARRKGGTRTVAVGDLIRSVGTFALFIVVVPEGRGSLTCRADSGCARGTGFPALPGFAVFRLVFRPGSTSLRDVHE